MFVNILLSSDLCYVVFTILTHLVYWNMYVTFLFGDKVTLFLACNFRFASTERTLAF